LLMFKILILQRYYNLGGQTNRIPNLGLTLSDRSLNEKTIWDFREQVTGLELEKELFAVFHAKLEENNLIIHQGKIVDASFVEMPRQRNSREENRHIKETGTALEEWGNKPNKKRQKDVDARWTKKNNTNHFGYKDHVKIDNTQKFIDTCDVTTASAQDSQVLDALLDQEKDKGNDLWADSAYTGEEQEKTIEKYQMKNHVHEKGVRGKPLTQGQKDSNREKSRTRARVEHVFRFIEGSMNWLYLNCVGLKRITTVVGLINLTYNLF
jgi:transposase, IS5 family